MLLISISVYGFIGLLVVGAWLVSRKRGRKRRKRRIK
jgi:hypothetical protein